MEEPIYYSHTELPKDYDSLLFNFIQLLEKHNQLVERYNYSYESFQSRKTKTIEKD